MKNRAAKFLAWLLWAAFWAQAAFIILVEHFLVPSIGQEVLVVDLLFVLAAAAMATTGTIVVSRLPGNPVGWLLLAAALAPFLAETALVYAQYTLRIRPDALPGGLVAGLISQNLWMVFLGSIIFLALLFPDGKLLSARWRWVLWGSVGALIALAASSSLGPELAFLEVQPPLKSPIAIAGAEGILAAVEIAALLGIAVSLIAVTLSMALRFTGSAGEERQQIKWFAYTAGLFTTYFVVTLLLEITGNPLPKAWDSALLAGFLSLLPAGVALAILKYRLYDIDFLINRTLVYGVLTAVLAVTYFGSVVVLQTAFRTITGQGSTVALVVSTLAIVALFSPLRNRVQVIIDRRFYRRKYDAARTVAGFSATARDEVDLERLTRNLVTVVQDALQPAHVSLQLRGSDDE